MKRPDSAGVIEERSGLVQLLQIAEAMGVADHKPGSAEFVHDLASGWRLANHYRTVEMADPDFVDVITDHLTDVERNARIAATVPADALPEVGRLLEDVGGETTHLVVVDADGMMVSMTNTLSNFWGSGQYALGFFLNDQLRYFQPPEGSGHPPEPGKRPHAYSTPTIVFDAEDRPVLAVGSPGGRRIPHVMGQVLLLWTLLGAEHPMAAHRLDSRCMEYMGRSPDAHEGVSSFLEKRPPRFSGRPSKDMPPFYPWWS